MNKHELSDFLDDVLNELQYRISEGIIDLNKLTHKAILSEILHEHGQSHLLNPIVQSQLLTEADPKTKDKPSNPNDEDYSHLGNGIYVKKGNEDKENAPKFKKDERGNYKAMSDAEAGDIKQKAGEDGGSTNNPEAKPQSGNPADAETAGVDEDVPTVNLFSGGENKDTLDRYKRESEAASGKLSNDTIEDVDTVNVTRAKKIAEDVYGDDMKIPLLQNSKTSDAALNFGYKKKALYVAPGNAGSNFNENMSNEGSLLLQKYPDLNEMTLSNILFERTRNTALGKQQKLTTIQGENQPKIPSTIPTSERNLYKSCVIAARSAYQKNKRSIQGKEKIVKQFDFGSDSIQSTFGGTTYDLKRLSNTIRKSNKVYVYDSGTDRGFEIPKEELLNWISSSGGGENASDTVILTTDNKGNILYDGWSDKKSLNDIQGNSTLNDDYTKLSNRVDNIFKRGGISKDDTNTANDIIRKSKKQINKIENGYKNVVYNEASFLNNSGLDTKTRLLKYLKKQERAFKSKKMTNHIDAYRKKINAQTDEELLNNLLENGANHNLIGTELQVVNLLTTMERMNYVKNNEPIPNGLDSLQMLSDARDNALRTHQETISQLNNLTGKTRTGKSKPLGDLLSFQETVDYLHIDKIDDPSDALEYEQILKRNTHLIMAGVNISPQTLKNCLGVDDLNDYEDNFETVLQERTQTDKKTGKYTTGKAVLQYAVNKEGIRKFIGEKRYRSKSGPTGKTDTTIQWSPEMQNCFNSKQK